MKNHRILLVDDEAAMRDVLMEELGRRGYAAVARPSADEAFALIAEEDFSVVVTDLNMRGMSGVELCERVVTNRPDIPVIVVTAFGTMETAVATLRAGAFDFLTKPFDVDQLALAIDRAIRDRELREELKRLRRMVAESQRFEELIGTSDAIRVVYDLIDRIAPSDTTVLISGETGTGKELVARAIHRRSKRSAGPLVTLNCAAVPENLLESELFGHVRGAFTDAKADRRGLFIQANGGTLFLDEVGEMPPSMQAKLLRALESRAVRPVGGTSEIAFDVRILAATHRDLVSAIEEGGFREDLYYRINVVEIDVPPLRARGGDALLLAQTFLTELAAKHASGVARLSKGAAERLLAYAWPGNIRELRNAIERAVALARYEEVVVEDLPAHIRDYKPSHVIVASDDPTDLVPLLEVERRYIERVMQAVAGNKRQAAKILGLDRATLYRRLGRSADRKND
jgi:two-component system response regulator AtoC